jgi:hypothetical protein
MLSNDLVSLVLGWRLWAAMAVLVMTPGILLRLVVLVYPRGDERRRELIAEMYAVPALRRPLWVFQQVEVVLWEGVPERWYQFAAGRLFDRWKLGDGELSNRSYPESFWIPPAEERADVPRGSFVKLMFHLKDGWGERMWVQVERRRGHRYIGKLANAPIGIPLAPGARIRFGPEHIIDIDGPGDTCECPYQGMTDCDLLTYESCWGCPHGQVRPEEESELEASG